jgi:putative hemolysin
VWGANGLIIQGAARESYIKPVITAGGQDNIILVWGLEKESDSQLMDIYAQKLNGNGASVWNEGAPLLIAESVPFFVQPALVSDGVGGAFVAWHNTELKSYVQHINSNGYFSMAEGGAPVANSGDNKQILPQLQFSPEGQTLFVFWLETDPGQTMRGIGGQKMNVNGWQLWGESGKTVVASSSADLTAVTPRLLGYDIVIFYLQGAEEQGVNPLESQVKAMLLDVAGNPFWGDQPAIISSVLSVKGGLEVGRILNQESIAVWVDMRDNGRDIYMHNLPQAVLFEQAHPATTFCSAHGGVWEYRYNDAGEGVDLCVFPDGSICEEWSYYLKECHPGEAWELDPGT